jgi:OmpA-OmpF porin, OOP family
MATSSLAFFSQVLPSPAVQSVASSLGTSERSLLEGVQSSIAAVVSGLSQRSGDRGFVGQVIQSASATPENVVSSAMSSGALTNPASPFVASGTSFVSNIFGNKLGPLVESIGAKTGLRTAAASAVVALGGETVLSYLGTRVRDGSINANNLPAFLARESDSLKGMLPPAFASTGTHKIDVNPVVAQSVQPVARRSVWPWLLPLLALLALLLWWAFARRPAPAPVAVAPPPAPAPVAVPQQIMSTSGVNLGSLVDYTLPDGNVIHLPERGVEQRLLAFIKDPAQTPTPTTWFDFDRLLFDTDSATLQPQSMEQLNNVAAIMKAYPNVHMTIGGYTDNTGDAAHNLKLSQDRADSVVAQLTSMGIAPDRLTARGYGDQHPVGDNSTPDGRAMNRRISMRVDQK